MTDTTSLKSGRAQAGVFRRVNRDILATLQRPGVGWAAMMALVLTVLGIGVVA